ncbi:MAG: Asp-tRNA(Asn)/Glu-tRNA(Gln) amidotransferase subunit GatC [Candidatus Omnitrophota bacterium]|jgi:aspartyl-tRNA(Asn)/glutamyl-tRNA(Gln) amidotransferase subunit C|nr:Asp-tRNA(Asn)/Glu-tRNA(Gln) amidotransferase subunit GatC [Candidatus Omnitrophota bacterium]MDD5665508.1 Asp-tRNA(Asn)/Glu-tRNA(Gln) amidotransferase subunit GatC [Candidatus Omnitrophota bacterium]
MIDKKIVEYVANLARIELKEKEADVLSTQLGDILGFIDKLKEVNVDKVSPTSHAISLSNVLREDSPKESLPVNSVLSNAPLKRGNFFLVPKVIE